MRHDGVPREYRTRLLRAVADGDHEIPVLRLEWLDTARGVAVPGYVVPTEGVDRQRVDARSWPRPCAFSVKSTRSLGLEIRLRHLAARGVPRAEEQQAKDGRVVRARLGGQRRVLVGWIRITRRPTRHRRAEQPSRSSARSKYPSPTPDRTSVPDSCSPRSVGQR